MNKFSSGGARTRRTRLRIIRRRIETEHANGLASVTRALTVYARVLMPPEAPLVGVKTPFCANAPLRRSFVSARSYGHAGYEGGPPRSE